MSDISHVHVRQLEFGDFDFVRELASHQPSFTVPPPYVLWLLLRIKGSVCLVAEHSNQGPVGYVLAVPMDAPSNALYVWQLAASTTGEHSQAPLALLSELHRITQRLRIHTVAFSAVPGSSAYRAVQHSVWKICATKPEATGRLPAFVSPNETEYCVRLPMYPSSTAS